MFQIKNSLGDGRKIWKGGKFGAKLILIDKKLTQKGMEEVKIPTQKEIKEDKVVLTLPPNTELVILLEKDIERLISEECFEKLSKFSTLTSNDLVNCLGNLEEKKETEESKKIEFLLPEGREQKLGEKVDLLILEPKKIEKKTEEEPKKY